MKEMSHSASYGVPYWSQNLHEIAFKFANSITFDSKQERLYIQNKIKIGRLEICKTKKLYHMLMPYIINKHSFPNLNLRLSYRLLSPLASKRNVAMNLLENSFQFRGIQWKFESLFKNFLTPLCVLVVVLGLDHKSSRVQYGATGKGC